MWDAEQAREGVSRLLLANSDTLKAMNSRSLCGLRGISGTPDGCEADTRYHEWFIPGCHAARASLTHAALLANDCSAQLAGSSGDENHRKGQLDEPSSSNIRRPSSEGTLRVGTAG
jgi:hypothetical protein